MEIASNALVEFSPVQASSMPGLIGSWNFNDGSANDATGVNNGQFEGAATTVIDTGAGSAGRFDCNGDGVLDAYQIAQGTLADQDTNGIPDCCEAGVSCTPCEGDVSGNGVVDGVDLAAVLGAWGSSGKGEFSTDTNGDGFVDGADLATVLSGWGPCPN